MTKFLNDKNRGRIAENFVLGLFLKFGHACALEDVKTYDIVLRFGKKKYRIEVKYDFLAYKTGNWAIEFHNSRSNKPSGIALTTADWWAHVVLDNTNLTAWICQVNKLKLFWKSNTPWKIVNSVGDCNADLALYREDMIMPIFTRIDDITQKRNFDMCIKQFIKG